jgi:hypothetical protein
MYSNWSRRFFRCDYRMLQFHSKEVVKVLHIKLISRLKFEISIIEEVEKYFTSKYNPDNEQLLSNN